MCIFTGQQTLLKLSPTTSQSSSLARDFTLQYVGLPQVIQKHLSLAVLGMQKLSPVNFSVSWQEPRPSQ